MVHTRLATDVVLDNIVPSKKVRAVMFQHGRIIGRTLTVVTPVGTHSYIRVLPTTTAGVLPIGEVSHTGWANVSWSQTSQAWTSTLLRPDAEALEWMRTTKTHNSLKSALRRARKFVGENAQKPTSGWTKKLQLTKLTSPYASYDEMGLFAKKCWFLINCVPHF